MLDKREAGWAEYCGGIAGAVTGMGVWIGEVGQPIDDTHSQVSDIEGQNDTIQAVAGNAQNAAEKGTITARDARAVSKVVKLEVEKNNEKIKGVEASAPGEYHWVGSAQGGEMVGAVVTGAVVLSLGIYGVRRARHAASDAIQYLKTRKAQRSLPHGNGWN